MSFLGTRSWKAINEFTVGDIVYVHATQFDQPNASEKYSDFFEHKQQTLLQAKILSIFKSTETVRLKFDLDNTISTVRYKDLISKLTEETKKFVYVGMCSMYVAFVVFSMSFAWL